MMVVRRWHMASSTLMVVLLMMLLVMAVEECRHFDVICGGEVRDGCMLMLLTQIFEVISETSTTRYLDNKNVFKGERKGYRLEGTVECKYIRQSYKGDGVMIVLRKKFGE